MADNEALCTQGCKASTQDVGVRPLWPVGNGMVLNGYSIRVGVELWPVGVVCMGHEKHSNARRSTGGAGCVAAWVGETVDKT